MLELFLYQKTCKIHAEPSVKEKGKLTLYTSMADDFFV